MKYDSSLNLSPSLPEKARTNPSHLTLGNSLDRVLIDQMKLCFSLRINAKQKSFDPSTNEIVRILVVDDNKEVRKLLDTFLNQCGFAVDIAENGLEALRKFNDHTFDMVLTDICMPGISGNVLSRQIKNTDSKTPIIAITASTALAENHFDEVLSKPIDLEYLLQTVHKALSKSDRYQSLPGLEDFKERIYNQKRR